MSDINMTPLVDVMLVLVVIFIITAPLMTSAIKLDLPKTQLADSLAKSAQTTKDTEVQLRADEAVPYGKVVEVMGVAQKAGLNRIGFVAEAKTEAKSPK